MLVLNKIAILSAGTLVLSGCSLPGIFASDGECGVITAPITAPAQFWHPAGTDSVETLETQLEWTLDELPANVSVETFAIQTLPVDSLIGAAVEMQLGGVSDGDTDPDAMDQDATDLIPTYEDTDTFILALENFPEPVVSVGGDYSLSYTQTWADSLLDSSAESGADSISEVIALQPFGSLALHMPITLVSVCGYDLSDVENLEPLNNTLFGPVGGARLVDSSTALVTPGYEANLLDVTSSPTSLKIGIQSDAPNRDRTLAVAGVTPWFSNDYGLVAQGVDLNVENMTPSNPELFWLTQLPFLNTSFDETDTFLQDSFLRFLPEDDAVTVSAAEAAAVSTVELSLETPLNSAFYEEALGGFLSDPEGSGLTEELGELEFFMVYAMFLEDSLDGDGDPDGSKIVSYSYEKFYPGLDGSLVDEATYLAQQQASYFQVDLLTSATDTPATDSEIYSNAAAALSGNAQLGITNLRLNQLGEEEFDEAPDTRFVDAFAGFSQGSRVLGLESGLMITAGYRASIFALPANQAGPEGTDIDLNPQGENYLYNDDSLQMSAQSATYQDTPAGALQKAVDLDQNIPLNSESSDKKLFGTTSLSFDLVPEANAQFLKFEFLLGMTEPGNYDADTGKWLGFISQYADGLGIFIKSAEGSWLDAQNCAAVPTTNSYLSMYSAGVLPPGDTATNAQIAAANYRNLVLETAEPGYVFDPTKFVDRTLEADSGNLIAPPGLAYSTETLGSKIQFVTVPMTCVVDLSKIASEGGNLSIGLAVANLYDAVLPPAMFISGSSIRFSDNQIAADVVSEVEIAVQVEAARGLALAAPYAGPVITTAKVSAAPGQLVRLAGSNLAVVSGVEIDGVPVELQAASATQISFVLPANTPLGPKNLTVLSPFGKLQLAELLTVVEASGAAASGVSTSLKRVADAVRVRAFNLVGAGKVVLMHNGKVIAWVRAVDGTDPKLRVIGAGPSAGSTYLVRTRTLLPGKNVFEIWVDGERIRRVAYTG